MSWVPDAHLKTDSERAAEKKHTSPSSTRDCFWTASTGFEVMYSISWDSDEMATWDPTAKHVISRGKPRRRQCGDTKTCVDAQR